MPYLNHSDADRAQMLRAIGVSTVGDLFVEVPLDEASLDSPDRGESELELSTSMSQLAASNWVCPAERNFLGAGYYRHFAPALVRAVLQRPEFYAPYALRYSEVHQGTLQALYEYQSLIATLTGVECVNASMYDGPSACAEAVRMALRLTGRTSVLVSEAVHPEVRMVVNTYISGKYPRSGVLPYSGSSGKTSRQELQNIDRSVGALVIQYPNVFGVIEDVRTLADLAHSAGCLLIAYTDPIALSSLRPPGEIGADVVVGEGQPLGLPMSFGGPSLGFFGTRMAYVDDIPGSVVEVCQDSQGRRGFAVRDYADHDRSALRERAVSNIGTTATLPAIAAAAYLAALGPEGFRQLGELCYHRTHYLAAELSKIPGCAVRFSDDYFREVVVEFRYPAEEVAKLLRSRGFLAGMPLGRWYPELDRCLLVTASELTPRESIDSFVSSCREVLAGLQQPQVDRRVAAP